MFPSNGGWDGPFPVLRETAGNPTSSTHDHHPSLFLNFPETFLVDCYNNEFLMTHFSSSQQQTMMNANGNNQLQQEAEEEPAEGEIKIASPVKATKKTTNKKKKNTKDGEKEVIPRKRTGKKDRHSKIYTAQGPRDRRMRLSLQIARKFFDLQDMLGFDKASKTIEWLFSKSRTAIKELTGSMPRVEHSYSGQSLKSLSSTSESEVVSGVKENESNKKKSRKPRSKVAINPVAKESRDKARARARERTKEKMKMRGAEKQKTEDPAEKLSSSVKEIDSASIIEKFLGMNTSTPQTVNYSQNVAEPGGAFSGQNDSVYPERWDRGYTRNDRSLNIYYYGEPGMKGSTGNNFQDQNPSAMFMLHPNAQEHRYSSSIFSNDREEHPNPVIMAPLNFLEHNPSSCLDPDTHFTENQFSCGGSFVAHKNCSFY